MKITDFFEHHGILGNPFAEEDAQTDLVFKSFCIRTTFHPAWDKLFGSPAEPATSVVFGEKGSGKTALRLQMVRALAEYNGNHPDKAAFVIEYDDFNPFLDAFKSRFSARKAPEKVLDHLKVWDHLDAILSLGTTQLIDRILYPSQVSYPAAVDVKPLPVDKLTEHQKRDLLTLLLAYDRSRSEEPVARFNRLSHKLQYRTWKMYFAACFEPFVGILGTVLLVLLGIVMYRNGWGIPGPLKTWCWLVIFLAGAWVPYGWKWICRTWKASRLAGSVWTLKRKRETDRKLLMRFPKDEYLSLPLPDRRESDSRYELLARFQKILDILGFGGIIVLIDRVDEPYLVNGATSLMKSLVWPMLDNKLLQHQGIGFKMLLLDSLLRLVDKESKEFHERSRIDKQNLVRNLDWTGPSLLDVANARLAACKSGANNQSGGGPTIDRFFDETLPKARLVEAFAKLKVPRHLFKFLYRLLVTHCGAHADDDPVWTISPTTFETTLAVYLKDRDAAEQQLGVV